MTLAEQYARASHTTWREAVRTAHARYDKTRCAGWLAATGNRPNGVATEVTLFKTPVAVVRVAQPRPDLGCDIHPVEP